MGNIYLIHGNDEYLKQKRLNDIKIKNKNVNQINNISFVNPEWEEVYSEITLPSFMQEEKMIIIYNSGFFEDKKKDIDKIVEFFDSSEAELLNFMTDLTLVFVEDEVKGKKLLKVISKHELFKDVECKKLMQMDRAKYLLDLAKKDNVRLEYAEAKYLVDIVEDDTFNAVNEYNKVRFLDKAIRGEKITKEDIDLTCIKNDEVVIFKITDYLISKDYEKAFKMIDSYYREGKGILILSYIYKYFKNVYMASVAILDKQEKRIAEILDLKPNQTFLADRYISVSKRIGEKKLRYIIDELIRIDEESKREVIDTCFRLKAILRII